MPNILWQILRPFLPQNPEFERSFAETFSLPEFRTIGRGGGRASSRMMSILASYEDFPEETAFKLLSNDMLLDKLKPSLDDDEAIAIVEAEIVTENKNLQNEKTKIFQELILEKKTQELLEQAHQVEMRDVESEKRVAEKEKSKLKNRLDIIEAELVALQKFQGDGKINVGDPTEKNIDKIFLLSILAASGFSAFIILGFEVIIYRVPWDWLRNHHNSLPIQIGIDVMIIFGLLGIFVKKWRWKLWGGVLLGVGVALLSLLGGVK